MKRPARPRKMSSPAPLASKRSSMNLPSLTGGRPLSRRLRRPPTKAQTHSFSLTEPTLRQTPGSHFRRTSLRLMRVRGPRPTILRLHPPAQRTIRTALPVHLHRTLDTVPTHLLTGSLASKLSQGTANKLNLPTAQIRRLRISQGMASKISRHIVQVSHPKLSRVNIPVGSQVSHLMRSRVSHPTPSRGNRPMVSRVHIPTVRPAHPHIAKPDSPHTLSKGSLLTAKVRSLPMARMGSLLMVYRINPPMASRAFQASALMLKGKERMPARLAARLSRCRLGQRFNSV